MEINMEVEMEMGVEMEAPRCLKSYRPWASMCLL